MKKWIIALLLLLVPVATIGCGDDPPTAPTPTPFTNEVVSEATAPAQGLVCVTFRQEAAGPAYASVAGFVPLEIGTGTCTSPGSVVARGERGEVSVLLAVGDHYVRFQNSFTFAFTFRVTLRYLILR